MKVSIVSLYGYFNYGNRLQNYAVQEILKGLGCNTTVIYIQTIKERIREQLKRFYFSKAVGILIRPEPVLKNKYIRQKIFEDFNKKNILTKRYTAIDKIDDADFFVLGSDQVWNPKRYNDVKKELFFLTFTESEKKICLAPSFGLSKLPENWKPYFAEKLNSFPMLSVREYSGAKIINELIGREAEVLIDPTLMIDKQEWLRLARKPKNMKIEDKYILNYFIGDFPESAVKKGEELAIDMNYKVYNLLDPESTELYAAGPAEFLYLIEYASLVQTDSFHACVFAFLFGRPFLVHAREGKDPDMFSRLETLLSKFNLERKYVENGIENEVFECDYQLGYEKLEGERKKVLDFLKESMHLEE